MSIYQGLPRNIRQTRCILLSYHLEKGAPLKTAQRRTRESLALHYRAKFRILQTSGHPACGIVEHVLKRNIEGF
jgi:hypothetical protein